MNDEQHQHVDPNEVPESEMKMPEGTEAPQEAVSSLGLILGVLIVILVLILGGLYLWGSTLHGTPTTDAPAEEPAERPTPEENTEPEATNAAADIQALETVSTSDEIEAIEADLEATDLDSIDEELEAIEAELDAALNDF